MKNIKEKVGELVISVAVLLAMGAVLAFGSHLYMVLFMKVEPKSASEVLCQEGHRLSIVENNNMRCENGVRCDYYLMCIKD